MGAKIIDGEAVAAEMNRQTAQEAAELAKAGRPPHLVAVQVGENPASKLYTNMQAKSCQDVGIAYELLNLPDQTAQAELLKRIEQLNADPKVTGVILQMPLPPHIDARAPQPRTSRAWGR